MPGDRAINAKKCARDGIYGFFHAVCGPLHLPPFYRSAGK
ncbi:unnamed protein product [Ciceribacter sp. T2.26MG-112.2]|uniref:Uncharacterized protein n=1 Tax=Ciceribacter selenitireducens ATCC BAA-1503 TaxID=1336235 RepID=A0A376AI54_9HYPH|nr:unnamed protein product [Ciceribacter selenitireducens ATCC BAA-1503]SSC73604.1 unnamed protein product [Ciceribacter naphthalenivorans]